MQEVHDPTRLETNPRAQWAVPMDLIEMQPVYHQFGAEGAVGAKRVRTTICHPGTTRLGQVHGVLVSEGVCCFCLGDQGLWPAVGSADGPH